MSKKWLVSLCLAASLSVVTACGGESTGEAEGKPSTQQEAPASGNSQASGPQSGEQPKMPEPDLKGIPAVVAEVNGEKIEKKEFVSAYEGQFQQAAMQAQMSGQKIDQGQMKEQTVNGMVSTELLIQEVADRGIEASQKDMNQTLDELAKQNQLKSGDEFMAALKKQGMSEKEVMDQLATQVKVEQLIKDEAGNTNVTEAELKAAYEQVKAQQAQMAQGGQGGKLPPLEEVKPELEKQVKKQKESEATQALVKELRKDAKVTINL
ncbi:SurA N-terminal domain-containing protein [Arthrobacter sp. H14]|uniref:SurA N-terminal domain-containing protein n=1 Tax=Arthrobacter sp. H14 TaxID=1312959 RepID=UPI000478F207|nr:SurA N-terminal domain-containing protein [Arthrobacter sp. H14]